MTTKKFMVSFVLVVPENNGMTLVPRQSVTAQDLKDEIQSWFEDLWCVPSLLQVEDMADHKEMSLIEYLDGRKN